MTFIREIEALGALVHPNIVRLLDVFADERRGMTIITEYCPGGTLLSLVLTHASSHSRAWGSRVIAFFRQLVAAVAFIHERHFVHLDLKSDNIVLDASRKVLKIIDFGLAVERSNVYERSIRGVQGTFWYMAPEVLDRSQHHYAGGQSQSLVPRLRPVRDDQGVLALLRLRGRIPRPQEEKHLETFKKKTRSSRDMPLWGRDLQGVSKA
ncbi:uncharacterized protein LOC143039084 [Oratosquilla oratoria]|uniref:uncharacterized protein LOC143039084 n=1 Tax=Oratosquilla oratoria TaxID=337810 RepID=UPI003F7650C5